MTTLNRSRIRAGFTIVELLVAMALILFIMVILSEAFKAGLDSFRQLRAAGDLAERLRSASIVLRKDLGSEHFEGPYDYRNTSGPYLRDQRLDQSGWRPPSAGFFRIWQENPSRGDSATGSTVTDTEGIPSTIGTNHLLHFTAKYRAQQFGDYFLGRAPGECFQSANRIDLPAFSDQTLTRYASQWAEIAYFLAPNGTTTINTTGAVPQTLYSLHRRVRVLPPVPVPFTAGTEVAYNENFDVSVNYNQVTNVNRQGSNHFFNTMSSIHDPRVRMDMDANGRLYRSPVSANPPQSRPNTMRELRFLTNPNDPTGGDDIILNDVVSFEIKAFYVMPTGHPGTLPTDGDAPFRDLPATSLNSSLGTYRVFDTWSLNVVNDPQPVDWFSPTNTVKQLATQTGYLVTTPNQVPLRIHVKALQIKIRVWDVKTSTTRQITIIQEV